MGPTLQAALNIKHLDELKYLNLEISNRVANDENYITSFRFSL
jgi:hypothetical protein